MSININTVARSVANDFTFKQDNPDIGLCVSASYVNSTLVLAALLNGKRADCTSIFVTLNGAKILTQRYVKAWGSLTINELTQLKSKEYNPKYPNSSISGSFLKEEEEEGKSTTPDVDMAYLESNAIVGNDEISETKGDILFRMKRSEVPA